MIPCTDGFGFPLPVVSRIAMRPHLLAIGFVLISIYGFTISPSRADESNWPQWRGPEHDGRQPDRRSARQLERNVEHQMESKNSRSRFGDAAGLGRQGVHSNRDPNAQGQRFTGCQGRRTEIQRERRRGQIRRTGGKSEGPPRRRPGRGMGASRPTESYQFVLLCLDRETGKTTWRKVAREEVPHEGTQFDNTFASNSPVTDGKYVIAYFGSRGLHCYDMDGNLKWEKDLGRMKTKLSFGEGARRCCSATRSWSIGITRGRASSPHSTRKPATNFGERRE